MSKKAFVFLNRALKMFDSNSFSSQAENNWTSFPRPNNACSDAETASSPTLRAKLLGSRPRPFSAASCLRLRCHENISKVQKKKDEVFLM